MDIVNWRREGLLLAIAAMETCLIVAWSRVFLSRGDLAAADLSWWSLFFLYLIALLVTRLLGTFQPRHGPAILLLLALFSTFFLLQVNPGGMLQLYARVAEPSTTVTFVVLLAAVVVWFRAVRIPDQLGDSRTMARRFQIGLVLMLGAVLGMLGTEASMSDLVLAYFGSALLGMALTRMEEVARAEPGGGAPLDRKWAATLAATLMVGGILTLVVTRVVSVTTLRWLLRPVVLFIQVVAFVSAALAAQLAAQLLPLLRWLLGDVSLEGLQSGVEGLRPLEPPPLPEQEEGLVLSPQLQDILLFGLGLVLALVAAWLLLRSFQRWQLGRATTAGATRESVPPDGSLVQDLSDFLQDKWAQLRQGVDLRRLLRRDGSVRAIYANLLAMLAAAEHPRRPEETPYEFQSVAQGVFPTRDADISAITEAYVRAHYGEDVIGPAELAELQGAWARIREDGEELLYHLKIETS
jgi:hypothetical protein